MDQGQAYFNGRWLEAGELSLPIDDLGVTLGVTVVERLRSLNHAPFRLDGHIRRLRRSLEIVGWDGRLADEVQAAIESFVARNAGMMTPGDDWAIVAFVTPGKTVDAARPTVCVHGFPLPFANWAHQFAEGVRVCITDVRQTPADCWPPELKCRSRMHYYLADREAARRYPGSRALLLDQRGYIGEASTANVVCYFKNCGLVIPRQEGVLPGISQECLFELADELGISRQEDDITPQQLQTADEAFLTSTSVCILPVVKVDDQAIGSGAPGPVFQQLLAAWSNRVGLDVAKHAKSFSDRT
jgi:branched-subunit amino acid aminotransferase/4-amino-4-deoxychorismate lyase